MKTKSPSKSRAVRNQKFYNRCILTLLLRRGCAKGIR
jgi:hypothetical protein